MNAAIFTKPAKGLILASGLIAASSVIGYAQEGTLSLGAAAQLPLTSPYQNPPAGMVTLGGHKFDLTSGNTVRLQDGNGASFTGSFKNPKTVYALVNSYDSYWWYNGASAGRLNLQFSDGSIQGLDLTVGGNVREWRTSGSGVIATTTDPATSNVWSGSAQSTAGGGSAVIDMLTIKVTSTGKTLTGVTLTNSGVTNGTAPLGILFSAVTVDYMPLTRDGEDKNDKQKPGRFDGENSDHGKGAGAPAAKPIATPAAKGEDKSKSSNSQKPGATKRSRAGGEQGAETESTSGAGNQQGNQGDR